MWFATSHHGAVSLDGSVVRRYSTEAGLAESHRDVDRRDARRRDLGDRRAWRRAASTRDYVTTFGPDDGLPVERVLQVLVDRRGIVWMATHGGGLVRYDGARFSAVPAQRRPEFRLPDLARGGPGRRAVGGHACRRPESAGARGPRTARRALRPAAVPGHHRLRGGATRDWWIGTYGGGLVNLHGGKLRTYTTADGLPSNAITSVAGGPAGSVWVGTNGGGAFRLENGRVVEQLGAEVVGATLRTIEVSQRRRVVRRQRRGPLRERARSAISARAEGLRSDEVRAIYAFARADVGRHLWRRPAKHRARRSHRQLGRARRPHQRVRDVAAPRPDRHAVDRHVRRRAVPPESTARCRRSRPATACPTTWSST